MADYIWAQGSSKPSASICDHGNGKETILLH
jgi:hypothetical protein